MGRWVIPEVYPLLGAMAIVGGMVVFSLGRHVIMNPDVRISKEGRKQAVLDNAEEGERYAEHGLRKFLRTRTPEIFPKVNRFFSDPEKST
ncbi:uncharacterized protein LOC117930887 [Vitis riparia]|uniref:uncharacterized protein LOC117930887 n=1 Tax=Vitis riparia TaxID=96939 RepID=UPI00155B359F|nr:uncharacterized protein LOC117930887 [Vitis riparia]